MRYIAMKYRDIDDFRYGIPVDKKKFFNFKRACKYVESICTEDDFSSIVYDLKKKRVVYTYSYDATLKKSIGFHIVFDGTKEIIVDFGDKVYSEIKGISSNSTYLIRKTDKGELFISYKNKKGNNINKPIDDFSLKSVIVNVLSECERIYPNVKSFYFDKDEKDLGYYLTDGKANFIKGCIL